MRHVLLISLFCTLVGPHSVFADSSFFSYLGETGRWYSVISDTDMRNTPEWNPDAEKPPLGFTTAVKIANATRKKLVKDSESLVWRLTEVKLVQGAGNHWYWVVEYGQQPRPGVALSGPAGFLRLGVLMNGKVIVPKHCVDR